MEQRYTSRAKMLDKPDTWVYGAYWQVGDVAVIIHQCHGNMSQHTAVDPTTVGKCTGRLDKKGVMIYEGDKVKAKWYPYTEMIVQWEESGKWNIADYNNKKGLLIVK